MTFNKIETQSKQDQAMQAGFIQALQKANPEEQKEMLAKQRKILGGNIVI